MKASYAAENLDGLNWYETARSEIRAVCLAERWDEGYFAGLLAVTSPRCSVRRNVRVAITYAAHRTFLRNTLRSVRRSVEIWEASRKINGPKTSAFYRAIMGDHRAIVVDVHMANLYQIDAKLVRSARHRRPIEESVTSIAKKIHVAPRDAQACLWFYQKRSQGESPAPFPIWDEYQNWLCHNREFPDTGAIDNLTADDSAVAYPLFDTPF